LGEAEWSWVLGGWAKMGVAGDKMSWSVHNSATQGKGMMEPRAHAGQGASPMRRYS
jgi:hypothetical protein